MEWRVDGMEGGWDGILCRRNEKSPIKKLMGDL
jgi:hypothetical protein